MKKKLNEKVDESSKLVSLSSNNNQPIVSEKSIVNKLLETTVSGLTSAIGFLLILCFFSASVIWYDAIGPISERCQPTQEYALVAHNLRTLRKYMARQLRIAPSCFVNNTEREILTEWSFEQRKMITPTIDFNQILFQCHRMFISCFDRHWKTISQEIVVFEDDLSLDYLPQFAAMLWSNRERVLELAEYRFVLFVEDVRHRLLCQSITPYLFGVLPMEWINKSLLRVFGVDVVAATLEKSSTQKHLIHFLQKTHERLEKSWSLAEKVHDCQWKAAGHDCQKNREFTKCLDETIRNGTFLDHCQNSHNVNYNKHVEEKLHDCSRKAAAHYCEQQSNFNACMADTLRNGTFSLQCYNDIDYWNPFEMHNTSKSNQYHNEDRLVECEWKASEHFCRQHPTFAHCMAKTLSNNTHTDRCENETDYWQSIMKAKQSVPQPETACWRISFQMRTLLIPILVLIPITLGCYSCYYPDIPQKRIVIVSVGFILYAMYFLYLAMNSCDFDDNFDLS